MSKQNTHSEFILALALFHRYGWLIAWFISVQLFPHQLFDLTSAFFIAFAAWSFIGYKRKWTHIYCSYQNAYHKAMTPKRGELEFHQKNGCIPRSAHLFPSGNRRIPVRQRLSLKLCLLRSEPVYTSAELRRHGSIALASDFLSIKNRPMLFLASGGFVCFIVRRSVSAHSCPAS